MIKQYGADAVRMAMIIGTSIGNDSKVSPDKFKAYKHFANKLWNIARYILSKMTNEELRMTNQFENEIMTKTRMLAQEVTEDMDDFKFYLAAEKLYHFIWHEYADKYIEESKDKSDPKTFFILHSSFVILLRLLHPFMPFVTEEIWGKLPSWEGKKLLIIEEWPKQ